MRDHVRATFPDVTWVCDKIVSDGCSRKRPDLLVDLGSHVVIVEIDESQHKGYSCETKRQMQLFLDVGCRPLVFVRFNPDGYTTETGAKVSTCWGVDKLGNARVAPKKQTEWATRLGELCAALRVWLHTVPSREFELVQLFYDAEQVQNDQEQAAEQVQEEQGGARAASSDE